MQASSLKNRLLGTAPWLVLAGVLGMLAGTTARAADQPALQAIEVQPLPGQQLQLTLRLSGPAPQPLSFTIDNPARISFDLPNTTLALPSRRIDVHASGLDTILAAETKDRTRLVLNLDKLVPYDTRVDGSNIIVMLGGSAARASTGPAPSGAVAASSTNRRASSAPEAPETPTTTSRPFIAREVYPPGVNTSCRCEEILSVDAMI